MTRLEDLNRGVAVKGVLPVGIVTVVDAVWRGSAALELTYKTAEGSLGNQLLYRYDEATLEIVMPAYTWSFEADGAMLRLVSEAYRIHLAHLFDPMLAVHTSLVEPLPHQITAVYGEMLSRQPLKFLLADDPGAGKTIMAGLLIKELLIRGDLTRCLVVCPGSLVEQWQDELDRRFHLPFEILTTDKLETARSGNWFAENNLAICRLDKLSRDERAQAKLEQTDWDLIICDEAHKMSAHFTGGEVGYTKRYRLGQFLPNPPRHFLLMTATPHNGKEADFQLFMALLDPDRFEGKFREGVHASDNSDMMRRLSKEQLLKFDGTPLFPERLAYTVNYKLSGAEEYLYEEVTAYVREEFNRADMLESEGRKGTIGFALTSLQRRLASSPEAIYQSLKRRKERLQKRLQEEKLNKASANDPLEILSDLPTYTPDDLEELDDAPDEEYEQAEEQVVDQASAARTIAELEAEIVILEGLEALALQVRHSRKDAKWEQLSNLLQTGAEMFDQSGTRRKLVIFTEHRDTLNYLTERIRSLLGRSEAVVTIHGAINREERRRAQEAFTQQKEVQVLVATDAAGEGINLQRAHLMVNYDLPWNPNRLEQRFGRIHRIGQTEVCHLWNLVAADTREGEVYSRLLEKLKQERESLGGQVFDVLGKVTFDNKPLRELLLEAIRYGDSPQVRAKLTQVVERALDHQHLIELLEEHALARDTMDASRVQRVREEMERIEARRLQPHYIASFFLEAFKQLGGSIREREQRRYEITFVPAVIRNRERGGGSREPVLPRYERITFEKELVQVPGKPIAAYVSPGHPLLEATLGLILERNRALLKAGAVLIDPADPGEEIRALFYIEHGIQDARLDKNGQRRVISRQMQFVELEGQDKARTAGYAPYLNYRPLEEGEGALLAHALESEWLKGDLERQALEYAINELVPRHMQEVRAPKEELVAKTMAAVKERLTKEIIYWDKRADELKAQELAGKTPRLNSGKARQRADDLQVRLDKRMAELEQEGHLSPLPPLAIGGALVIPTGLLARLKGNRQTAASLFARETKRVELAAMAAVMAMEQGLGYVPKDVSADKCGWDIESKVPGTGKLRFIEVKGRIAGAETVTVSKNEILAALNKPEDFILALAQVPQDAEFNEGDAYRIAESRGNYSPANGCVVRYVKQPFNEKPDFSAVSVNYDWQKLWERGTA
ncbi:MAG: DUF3883 domain-containing protein [Chloroflexi bacterium]|uniref:DUF3883 domain-containing protein n=1 Tax=Candidatus Chlorohelix allophototropha TaxID=3003348 RepID=A0A8T7M4R6_9CHLR|nr:DUF3883 domain-containing protein [Chloroflexota bacterium]